uniref:NADH-ubiquinone oxidoreductase chain 5 n=1 Tax=Brachycybe lecontii TaxID=1176341 RepID=S4T0T5_BRALC|nr:NADH dehydrogenase subunit 5 [Brachycybe lecontii]AFR77045.1 NADH dehydrogenase subunit 5 [Brachycybe lecontii]
MMVMGLSSSIVILMSGGIFFFFLFFLEMDFIVFIEWSMLNFNSLLMSVIFLFDWMSMLFICVVLIISGCVMMYSLVYMEEDKSLIRFLMLVMLFIFSMLLLIISPSFIGLLLGWDGLGLVSYCLVIYYSNSKSSSAGMLTILTNRVGDAGLMMSIAFLFSNGSWWLLEVNLTEDIILWMVLVFLLLASFTKSAQIPFSAWLPAAMAAPTPVSALVHSSTLVTAGVYLLIRFYSVYSNMFYIKNLIMLLALFTMFCAGIMAVYEYDFKKIIALSTLSQLGLMMFVLGMGYPDLCFFHLVMHALFKALIFLCAGKVIHESGGVQDIRYLGGMFYFSPLMAVMFMLANGALCGFPFLAGFYSKDLILESFMYFDLNFLKVLLLVLSVILTCVYSMRVMLFVLLGNVNLMKLYSFKESEWFYLLPMCLLGMGSLFGGIMIFYLAFWNINFLSLFYFESVWVFLSFFVVLYFFIYYILGGSFYYSYVMYFFSSMGYLVYLSSQWIMYLFLVEGKMNEKVGDGGWLELAGSKGLWGFLKNLFMLVSFLQNNLFKNLLIMMVIFLFIFYLYMMVF